MEIRKILASALAFTVICGTTSYNNCIISKDTVITANAVSSGINVTMRTPDEITAYIKSHPFDTYSEATYESQPSVTSPYSAGTLDSETLTNALNTLNVMRYIAGLEEVALNSEYNELAQNASLLNAVNNSLSHSPEQPSDMSDSMYQLGYEGASSCNIGMGYSNPASSITRGYMYDGNASNISRVGHRRWCLNPTMKYTGFGQVGRYTAMYAFDRQGSDTSSYGVCWPAQNMPVAYFNASTPWSISMGYSVDSSNVKVTLTRESDSKVWNFSNTSSDGEFYVDNGYYGQQGCIIFMPNDISEYSDSDVFNVEIEGLNEPISYTVNFFDSEKEQTTTTTTTTSTTTTTTTVTVEPELKEILGDVNGDSAINSIDASLILAEYARISLGKDFSFTETQQILADVNKDGFINSSDSSAILAYYAYISSGGSTSIENFLGIE